MLLSASETLAVICEKSLEIFLGKRYRGYLERIPANLYLRGFLLS